MRTTIWSQALRLSATLMALLLVGSLMLACGGDDEDDDAGTTADPTETLDAVTGTPEGGGPTPPTDTFGTVTQVPVDGSPEASPDASPEASSPDASPVTSTSVDMATAWESLLAQDSYAMTIDFEGLPEVVESVPLVEAEFIMELESVGDDRHVVLSTVLSGTVLEMWAVDDEIYVDYGDGPTALDEVDTLGLSADVSRQLINAPEELIGILALANADWDVTGEEEVNDFTTIVQESTYEASALPDTIYFDTESSEIDATMWVETEDEFLVQLDATLTDMDTSTTGGSPVAEPPARIFIDVLSVGDIDEIEVPTSN